MSGGHHFSGDIHHLWFQPSFRMLFHRFLNWSFIKTSCSGLKLQSLSLLHTAQLCWANSPESSISEEGGEFHEIWDTAKLEGLDGQSWTWAGVPSLCEVQAGGRILFPKEMLEGSLGSQFNAPSLPNRPHKAGVAESTLRVTQI